MLKICLLFLCLVSVSLGHGMSEAEKQIIVEGGNLHYIYVGAVHMLWGYDHLLFVLGIIFFLQSFKDIVKYITTFTIGHSITLIYATFNSIEINYYLIDAIIALSVCLIGIINLGTFRKFINFTTTKMLGLIFILGLIHGLGLSTRLQQLPLDPNQLFLNIISFNVGIELGQIIALAVMLVFINIIRKSKNFNLFSLVVNSFIVIAGVYFFIVQLSEYKSSISQNNNFKDEIIIVIKAKGEKEYKVWQIPDENLIYSWETSPKTNLFFDFHGEPASSINGYFESFKETTSSKDSGSRVSTFIGTHGWYWKNNSNNDVVLTLKLDGEYRRMDKK